MPILAAFEKISDAFSAWNHSEEMEQGLFRITIPDYDPRAFREALVNAFCHRDYSVLGRVLVQINDEGMTISNPGGFIEGIRVDNLLDAEPHGRNPALADQGGTNMNTKKLMTLLLAVVLVLSLAACGAKGGDHMGGMDNEPKNAEEAAAMHKELTAQEAAILAENTALWEKVFMAADKGKIMMEDGKNYGDFLLETINAAKDQFSADELKLLQSEAEKIRDIGNKLAALEEKYPEIVQKSLDSDMNMPTDKDMDTMPDSGSKDNKTDGGNTGNKTDSGSTGNTPDNGSTGNKTDSGSTGKTTDDSSLPKFPAFEGKDLDGNTVKSSDLFSGNAVTVVNFWFTTCGPCVGELGDLDALNKELSGKGGALIGINAFTLDGNEAAISDDKDVLTQSGATYQNVYFDSGSEAGKFVESIYAYPTTYVVNRSGRIVGDPIVGAITSKAQADALQAQIDKALAADMG